MQTLSVAERRVKSGSGGTCFGVLIYGSGGAMDAAGNLYGTTFQGGAYQGGNVFRLSFSNGQWIYADLHDFSGGADGAFPLGGVGVDANGNLYGTTEIGGTTSSECTDGCGVVWEITP